MCIHRSHVRDHYKRLLLQRKAGIARAVSARPEKDLEEKKRVAVRYGTEASVYGKKGFDELKEFATHGSGKGYARVDAKAANLEIRLHISTNNAWGGQGLLFVPIGFRLNKAHQHITCSFVLFKPRRLVTTAPYLKCPGHTATWLGSKGTGEIGNFPVWIRVRVPTLLTAGF